MSDFPARVIDSNDPTGSDDHPFGFIQMVVDREGNGEGQMIAAASIQFVEGTILFESAGVPLLQINQVSSDSPPR